MAARAISNSAPASVGIGERRADAINRLNQLRSEQGAALLDGRPFDHAPLVDAEREIDGLEVAEGEAARREREAAAKVMADARKKMRRQIRGQDEKRLEAVERAERAAVELVTALEDALELGAEIRTGIRVLGARPVRYLERIDYARRLSCRLAFAFLPLTGPGRHFGDISFPDSGLYRVPWRDAEAALTAAAIDLATEGTLE